MPAHTSALSDVSALTVGVLGGTEPQGRGLTYRLASAGQRAIVGSRVARRRPPQPNWLRWPAPLWVPKTPAMGCDLPVREDS
jgi:hypothetical protein